MAFVTMKTFGSLQAGAETITVENTRVFFTAVVVEYFSNPEYDLNLETEFKAAKERMRKRSLSRWARA